jgi:hypothetical protein
MCVLSASVAFCSDQGGQTPETLQNATKPHTGERYDDHETRHGDHHADAMKPPLDPLREGTLAVEFAQSNLANGSIGKLSQNRPRNRSHPGGSHDCSVGLRIWYA